jgi:hypothetical protein
MRKIKYEIYNLLTLYVLGGGGIHEHWNLLDFAMFYVIHLKNRNGRGDI